MGAYRVSSGRSTQSARWVGFANIAVLGCLLLTGCSADPDVANGPPSASSVQPSPAQTGSSPSVSADPSTTAPSPVDRPCRFEGKDLNDYKSIVKSFDAYFNGLSANVLSKHYKASAAELTPLDQTADQLIARLQAGDVKQTPNGFNVVQDMESITRQTNDIVTAAMKAHPDLSPELSPAALRASLKRQRDRLGAVAILCIQRNAAG
jgi:hypothetical protein